MRAKFAVGAVAPLLLLGLSACGSDDSSADKPKPTPTASNSPTAPEPSPTEEAETPAADVPAADMTKPGSTLKVGESATIAASYAKRDLVIKLTVKEIKEGTGADLESLDLDGSKFTPYYVKVTGQVVSGDAYGYNPASNLTGVIGERPARKLIEFGKFEPCNGESFPTGVKPGDTLESCTTQVASKGEKVDSVVFASTGTDYDRFKGKPVTWR